MNSFQIFKRRAATLSIVGMCCASVVRSLALDGVADMQAFYSLQERLQQEGMKVIDELAARKAMPELLKLLDRSFELDGNNQNGPVKKKIVEAITQMPGYATYLGDRIEVATAKRGVLTYSDRCGYFRLLQYLGTNETMEQAARFLFDERHYEAELNPPVHIVWDTNVNIAAETIYRILQQRGEEPFKLRYDNVFLQDYNSRIQTWWKSDASLPYRKPKPAATNTPPLEPLPPPPAARVAMSQPIPATEKSNSPWALAVILLSLAALLVVYFSSRKRGEGGR